MLFRSYYIAFFIIKQHQSLPLASIPVYKVLFLRMFTRYSDNQFLMLLLGIRQEDCVIVVERINGYFEKASRKNYLKYSTAPISEIMEVDDCVHFHNMDSMWGE